eukprot:gnl/MRDRNA2_/MRDRNA2_110787_c0_seq1.p1 gnl/MRDRNA2_/MRDRNA2_110787_c0~~gnl/MRDRNA2_/MRDRNA2_110787_c0_seq1.p1  ORF type:complete len:929 (-),score=162.28 gnl/MRDRNA2_/MRDRNA2_110787_c0_seq1:115-2901(-)
MDNGHGPTANVSFENKGGAYGKVDPGSLAIYDIAALQDLRECVDQLPPDLADLAKRMMKNIDALGGNVTEDFRGQDWKLDLKQEEVELQITPADEKKELEFEEKLEHSVEPLDCIGDDEKKQMLEDEEAEEVADADEVMEGRKTSKMSLSESTTVPIMQFTTSTFFCTEGEDKDMVIDVMRIGEESTTVSCQYHTEDLSAKAGHKYEATSGEIQFLPGEYHKSIKIPILDDDNWDSTLEFLVVLTKPVGGQLGRTLYRTRVKVIDDDVFPSNVLAERIHQHTKKKKKQKTDFALMKEYFKMNVRNPVVKKATYKMLIYGQAGNLYFIFQLILTQQLIDKVLGECEGEVLGLIDCPAVDDKEARFDLLILFMLLFILPYGFVHLFDYRRNFWKLGGASRKTLQSNLLRKFLNYDEDSRSNVNNSEILMAINRDSPALVTQGYLQLFPLCWSFSRLLFIIILQLAFGEVFAIIPVVLFPLILLTYLKIRGKLTRRSQEAQNVAQDALVAHVEATSRNFRILADYAMRPTAVDEFDKHIGAYNSKNAFASAVTTNNKYMAPWLSTITIGLWFVIGGRMYLYGSSELGAFITMIGVFKEVGSSWAVIYGISLSVQEALVPLGRITTLMNMPTDLHDRKKVNHKRKEMSEQLRSEAHELAKKTGQFAADIVPIKIIDVSYEYANFLPKTCQSQTEVQEGVLCDEGVRSFQQCNADIHQGSLVALVGPPGGGKSTMLKLIGGVLFPHTGVVAVPPHLRVLHISQNPVFFQDSLLNNLIYGLKPGNQDAAKDRVLEICKILRVPKHLHSLLDTDESDDIICPWDEQLSLSQRAQLNLARAMVNNPNLLVLHKPTLYLNDELTTITFRALRQFVENRGLALSAEGFQHRRARTCILTTSRSNIPVSGAHAVFEVKGDRIRELEPKEITKMASGFGW